MLLFRSRLWLQGWWAQVARGWQL